MPTTPTIPVTLGLYVAASSAAGFQIEIDAACSTPVLSGTLVISETADVRYELANVDYDITAILLGASSSGCSITSFVNNGDGTGYILVAFTNTATHTLAVVAQDDVGNLSGQSNVLAVVLQTTDALGTTFRLRPQARPFDNLFTTMVNALPAGTWIDRSEITLPFKPEPTLFELEAITPGVPVLIQIEPFFGDLVDANHEVHDVVVVPEARKTIVPIQLFRGVNVLRATDGERVSILRVSATHAAGLLSGYAREIYTNIESRLRAFEADLNSPLTTALLQPYVSWFDLLPSIRSLQVLGAKMAVRALVNEPRRQSGIRDFLAGVTGSTPILNSIQNPTVVDLRAQPLHHSLEHRYGTEAHVWLPNRCVSRWAAFTRILPNLPVKTLSISERAVVIEDDTGTIVQHAFDDARSTCSIYDIVSARACFDSVAVGLSISNTLYLRLCAAAYSFDLCSNPEYPFSVLEDEAGETGLDPGWDGLADYCLLQRMDGGYLLDSYGSAPASGVLITSTPPAPDLTEEPYKVKTGLEVSVYGERQCVFEGSLVTQHILISDEFPEIEVVQGVHAVGTTDPAVWAGLSVPIAPSATSILALLEVHCTNTHYNIPMDLMISASAQEIHALMSVHVDSLPWRRVTLEVLIGETVTVTTGLSLDVAMGNISAGLSLNVTV